MKTSSILPLLAIVISLVSIGLTLSIEKDSLTPGEIDALVDEGIIRREKAFVEEYNPFLQRLYKEMLMPDDYAKVDKNPETIEELFQPLIQLITYLSI